MEPGAKMAASRGARAHGYSPEASTASVLAQTVSRSESLHPQKTLQDPQVGLAQGPMESLIFSGPKYL